jgi:hypothetical protein
MKLILKKEVEVYIEFEPFAKGATRSAFVMIVKEEGDKFYKWVAKKYDIISRVMMKYILRLTLIITLTYITLINITLTYITLINYITLTDITLTYILTYRYWHYMMPEEEELSCKTDVIVQQQAIQYSRRYVIITQDGMLL